MISFEIYERIQNLKNQGYNRNKTAIQLHINFGTVKKYWNMKPDEFLQLADVNRRNSKSSQYKEYESEIKKILEKTPHITSSKIYEQIAKNRKDPDSMVAERTMRNYVKRAKEEMGF